MQKGRVLSRPSPTHIRATPLASLPTGSRLGDRHDSPPADTKNQPFPSCHMRPALRPALVPCLLHFIQFNEDARCIRQAVASHYGTFIPHLLHGLILPVTHTHSALHCTLKHMPTVFALLRSFLSFPSPLAFCVHCQRRWQPLAYGIANGCAAGSSGQIPRRTLDYPVQNGAIANAHMVPRRL